MANRRIILFSIVFAANFAAGQSAKILTIFPIPTGSHYILGSSLSQGLVEHGHEVTLISPYKQSKPSNNTFREIVLSSLDEEMEEFRQLMNPFNESTNMNPFSIFQMMMNIMKILTEGILKHPNVQKLLQSDEKFDLVIYESFNNQALSMLSVHFNAPTIIFSSVGSNIQINDLLGNPTPTSYIPHTMLPYSPPLSFTERLLNNILTAFMRLANEFIIVPMQNDIIKKYFPINPPHINDLAYNASLALINTHVSVSQPVPYVPNMIDIGGYHVRKPKPLPKDLKDYMDNAKEGVILFSLGSHLNSSLLPIEKRNLLMQTFSKLKMQVLWKFEMDDLPGKPDNVRIEKWLPQNDLLAHPNLKLFITHAGLLSTTEIIYHGIPVIAIPIVGDQQLNALNIVKSGLGLSIQFKDINEENLLETIHEVISNPKYRENAKTKSQLFHDRQNKPMDTAAYWVDYVVRHKGARHLRVAALDLPWYQYHCLDIFAIIAIVLALVIAVQIYVLKKVVSYFCSKKSVNVSKNKKHD